MLSVLWCYLTVAALANPAQLTGTVAAHHGEAALLDADKLNFDKPSNMAYGEGHVVVQYKGATLRADRVRYNSVTQEAWAEGNVRLSRAGQEWVTPAAYYNFETKQLKTGQARSTLQPQCGTVEADLLETESPQMRIVGPMYLRGEQVVSVGTNRFDVERLSLTPCNLEHPHFRLEARHAEIWPGDRVALHNVTVRAGEVPVFWFPMVIWSLKGDSMPLTLSVGESGPWGFFVLTTMHWRLNEHLALNVHLDERTQRGIGTGADLKYRYDNVEGLIKGYYSDDARPEDDLDRLQGKDLPRNRYTTHWEHQQALRTDLKLTINLNKQSDTDIVQDFFESDYRRLSEPESVVDATWRGDQFTLSALTRPQLNRFYAEVERVPEVKLAVNRTRLWQSPFFYEGASSAGYYHNVPGLTGDPQFVGDTPRVDTFHQIVMPQTLWGWLAVVPRAGIRGTWYLRAPDTAPKTNEVGRAVYDLGLETSFKLWHQWDNVKSTGLGIDGLRHIVQPFADYQWVPQPDVATTNLFQFDATRFTTLGSGETIPLTRYTALGFPANDAIDSLDRQNVMRFGLRQKLQTCREGRPWDLVELEGWTDYHVEHGVAEKDFNDAFGTVRLRPASWFMTDAFVRYNVRESKLRELNTDTRVFGRGRWSVAVGTRFAEQDSNLVNTDVAWQLTRLWRVQARQSFDMEDGHWEQGEYILRQETHDWYINYGVRYRGERITGDEWMVFFAFTLKAFPGVHMTVN